MKKLLDFFLRPMRHDESVSDEEVIRAIKSIPRHFAGFQERYEHSFAPWAVADPAPGNVVAGSGILTDFSYETHFLLRQTAGQAEIRTLPDPLNANIRLALVLTARNGFNLVVRGNTPLWVGATVTQPALTQNGQFLTFSALNQVVLLESVPCTKTQFVGTQSTVTNSTGYRWTVNQADGATLT